MFFFVKRTTFHVILTYAFIGKKFSTCTLSFEKLSMRLIIKNRPYYRSLSVGGSILLTWSSVSTVCWGERTGRPGTPPTPPHPEGWSVYWPGQRYLVTAPTSVIQSHGTVLVWGWVVGGVYRHYYTHVYDHNLSCLILWQTISNADEVLCPYI